MTEASPRGVAESPFYCIIDEVNHLFSSTCFERKQVFRLHPEAVIGKLLTAYAYSLLLSDEKKSFLSAFTPFAEKTWLETTFLDEEGYEVSEAGDRWTCLIKFHHQIMGKRMIWRCQDCRLPEPGWGDGSGFYLK